MYVRGAKVERLIDEVVCAPMQVQGASVRVPPVLYPILIERLKTLDPWERGLIRFLTHRADKAMLPACLEAIPAIYGLHTTIASEMWWDPEAALFARLHREGLLPAPVRQKVVAKIVELTIDNADGSVFAAPEIKSLLTDPEYEALSRRFYNEVVTPHIADPLAWERCVITSDMPSYIRQLKDGLDRFIETENIGQTMELKVLKAIDRLEERARELEEEENEHDPTMLAAPQPISDSKMIALFCDIDA